jgi:predicted DNA-binding transcriptional regulator AlpA
MSKELTPLLGPRDLASLLNVRPGTVFSWLSRGADLPPSIKIGGTTRWRPEVVMQWIQKKEKEKRRKNFKD